MKYIIYGSPGCNFCSRARNLLTVEKQPFVYIDLTKDPKALAFIIEMGHRTVPQVYLEDAMGVTEYIGGYEDLQDHIQRWKGSSSKTGT
jgi:glutaredoxin